MNQNQPSRQLPPLPENANQKSQQMPSFYAIQAKQTNNISLGGTHSMQSMQSMQSIGSMQSMVSSETIIMEPPESPLQTFPVIYNNRAYMVNPASLINASLKVRELVDPFLRDNHEITELRLQVLYRQFTNRNMENFLRICQNLTADVKNSEMEEICEIAKMFQAEKIYNCGLEFIQKNIDSNFYVPETKYKDKSYLIVECDSNIIHHANLEDLSFEETGSMDEEGDTPLNTNNIRNNNENQPNNTYNQNNNSNANVKSNENADSSKNNNNLSINNASSTNTNDSKSNNTLPTSNIKSVIYRIRHINHGFKCTTFTFSKDGVILYSAKLKENNVYIGKGEKIHIRNHEQHVAHIFRKNNNFNVIQIEDMQFQLTYVPSGRPNHLSLEVSFPLKDKQINWSPKTPKYNPMTNKYYLNFHGHSGHTPIRSSKNIVLANATGHTTFIVRKVGYYVYETECLPLVDPLIAFTIGLSDIIGPYMDPLGDIVI